MAATRKSKALGWAAAAVLLLAGAGVCFSRPAPALIPVDQLEARSASDATSLASAIPRRYADKPRSLQGLGGLSATLSEIAKEDGVSAVRLWSPSGLLLASDDPQDPAAATAAEKTVIGAAHGVGAAASTLADQPGLLRIFEPVLPDMPNAVVAEVVRNTSETGLPFRAIAAGLAALGALSLITALLSLRGGSAGKVPASPAVPADSAPAAEEPDDDASPAAERDGRRLAQKLKTSEASRAAMETQMEQLRAQLRMGTFGSEQVVAELDSSLASSQLRAHEAGEKLALAETHAKEAEQRALIAEEALARATPSEAADRLIALEAELATVRSTIAVLEGAVSEHQARTRDAEARSADAEKRATAVTDQVAEHAARAAEVESRQRELENRSGSAEARASQAEGALAEAVQRAAEAQDSAARLKIELARAQDLAEHAAAKLQASEARVAPPSPRTPDVPPDGLSLADFSAPITAPVADVAPATPPPAPVEAEPQVEPADDGGAAEAAAAEAAAVEGEAASATDPNAWKALAKSLRRNARGGEAGDEPDEEEAPEEPVVPLTDEDRSEMRARLARASAKKRRKLE